jgi:hypothetical protein
MENVLRATKKCLPVAVLGYKRLHRPINGGCLLNESENCICLHSFPLAPILGDQL